MTQFSPPTPEMTNQSARIAELIEQTRDKKMTPAEIQEQKISFVFGQLSAENKMTREEVAAQIYERDGNLTAMEKEIKDLRYALGYVVRILSYPVSTEIRPSGFDVRTDPDSVNYAVTFIKNTLKGETK